MKTPIITSWNMPLALMPKGAMSTLMGTKVKWTAEYTLQITMVDLTGNFPPPCRVSIVIQN
jgi:hypothetical protein